MVFFDFIVLEFATMSKYEDIEAFVRTVEAGSFTAAAEQMGVAKSAVSRRIQDLETRLGSQLIIRTTRKLSLTEQGHTLFERAKLLLQDWEEAEASVASRTAALAGTIRVTAPLTFGVNNLGPAFIKFLNENPCIELDVDFSDRKVDLVSEGMDLAIRIGKLPDSGLIARKLAKISSVAAASPEYIEQHGKPKTHEELALLPELRYGLKANQSWTYTAPDGNVGTFDMPSKIKSTNGDFLKNAAIEGKGIVIMPLFILHDAIKSGSLVRILEDYKWPELGAYAIYPPTRHLSARVRKLVDFLADYCGGNTPYWEEI